MGTRQKKKEHRCEGLTKGKEVVSFVWPPEKELIKKNNAGCQAYQVIASAMAYFLVVSIDSFVSVTSE